MVVVALVFLIVRKLSGERVDVSRPARGELVQSLVTSGRVRPVRIRLAPIVPGIVRQIDVQEGQSVRAGQTLLRLDDTEAKAMLANANAALARVTASQKKLRTLSRKEADEAVRQARARLAEAKRDFERHKNLVGAGAVTRAQFDQAKTNLTLARSVLRTSLHQRRDLQQGGATVMSHEAELAQARADVALAKARLGYTQLQAPVDGVVLTRSVEVGDSVGANSQVMTVAATGHTELVIEPDERNLSLLRLGQHALASAEAFPERRFNATVSFIAPSVDSRRGTIEVRLAVPKVPDYLRPDMTVSVDIEVARKANALTVPISSVVDMASTSPYVLVVDGSRVARKSVSLGIRDERRVEIVSGLEGTEWVLRHPEGMSQGQRVRTHVVSP